MTRWVAEESVPQDGSPIWRVLSTKRYNGFPAVIATFPSTARGRWDAQALAATLNAEYVAGMRDAQVAARQAFAMALGTDEKVFELPKESYDDVG